MRIVNHCLACVSFFILDNSLRLGAPRSLAFVRCGLAAAFALAGCGDGTSPSVPANAPSVADAGVDQSVDAGATVRSPVTQPAYTDGPRLPANTAVTTPWHLLNVRVTFDRAPETFETFCVRFRVEGEVGENVNLYFSPFNSTINQLPFYGGVQTAISGLDADGHRTAGGRGGIFSRWRERDTAAITRAPGGLIESSGHEGDFIGVRNSFAWGEGRYRLCLRKSERIDGAPLPAGFDADDIAFGWGRYEHTWVRMEATDLNAGTTTFVGALAITPYAEAAGAGPPGPPFSARFSIATGPSSAAIASGTLRAHIEAALSTALTPANENAVLQRLTRLEVEGGTIDRLDGLERAVNLQVLRLPHHRVSNLSPLMDLRQLRVVDLSGNRIRTLAPLAGLARLEELNLSHNQVDSLHALANLARLRSLDVSGNRVDTLAALAGLGELRTLNVSGNRLGSLVSLAGLTQLRSLDASDNRLDGLRALAGLVGLRSLDLSGNRVESLADLGGLTGLGELDISRNRIARLAPLSGLPALTNLDAGCNRIADLRPLTGSVRLQRLALDNNRIVDIRSLAGLTGLSRLSIGFNWIADLSALDPLVADGLQVVGRGEQSRAPAWSGAKPPPSGSRPFAECSQ